MNRVHRLERVVLVLGLLLLFLGSFLAGWASGQDRDLTPGKVRELSHAQLCGTKWGSDRRVVTVAMRRHVFKSYGIAWENRAAYEVDHLIPRSLGGADDVLNLWPQPWPDARKKDRLEIALSKALCDGKVHDVRTAQRVFEDDWRAGYRRYIEGDTWIGSR